MIRQILRKIYKSFRKIVESAEDDITPKIYWEKRARKYGTRSVLNIGHPAGEVERVTNMQMELLFPLLKQQMNGTEQTILDFGCGPGRFTPELAKIINGKAIGVDIVDYLLSLAPQNGNIEYRKMTEGVIPLADSSVDVVWICLVLGGIVDDMILKNTIFELNRVLKKEGMIFLVENTSSKKDGSHWKFRSIETYQQLFDFTDLKYISHYFDLNEQISVMVGKKCIKN